MQSIKHLVYHGFSMGQIQGSRIKLSLFSFRGYSMGVNAKYKWFLVPR